MQRNNQPIPGILTSVENGNLHEFVRAVAAELKRQLERRGAPPMVESTDKTEAKKQITKQG